MNFDFINAMHGWTTPLKAQQLYDLTKKLRPTVAVEIGVWGGRGTIAVALAMKENHHGRVIAIDPWSPTESEKGQTEPVSAKWWSEQNHEDVYSSFLWHLKRHGVEECVTIRRATSNQVDAAEIGEIGLLIIDGNHGEQAVMDAKKFAPLVGIGGICLLDDLDWIGGYVRQAEEYIKSIGFSFLRTIEGQTGVYQRAERLTPGPVVEVEDRKIIEETMSLTVAYITARIEPKIEWFFESLANQLCPADKLNVIVVDTLAGARPQKQILQNLPELPVFVKWVEPKPTVWQGRHRLPKDDWWAASNARNTAICLCETEWIAFLDDRCVLMPGWLEAVKRAMRENCIVLGSYEKRTKLVVENGYIKGFESVTGSDMRVKQAPSGMKNCPASWAFGCTLALPLEMALAVNGFEEGCDGLSVEDVIFGMMLRNAGFAMNFDPAMRMIEDRTPGECGPTMKRSSKEKHPNDKTDKGHAALKRFGTRKETEFTPDLRAIRAFIAEGRDFPVPTTEGAKDWFDGQLIAEFE